MCLKKGEDTREPVSVSPPPMSISCSNGGLVLPCRVRQRQRSVRPARGRANFCQALPGADGRAGLRTTSCSAAGTSTASHNRFRKEYRRYERKSRRLRFQMRCVSDAASNPANGRAADSAGGGRRRANHPAARAVRARPYFCQERQYGYYQYAQPAEENAAVARLSALAREAARGAAGELFTSGTATVCTTRRPFSTRTARCWAYTARRISPTTIIIRKKFYFTPGNTGFRVWNTRYARIGVGICWDQWFPETARCLALNGAELLLFPTAIGSEPVLEVDSAGHWQRCICRTRGGEHRPPSLRRTASASSAWSRRRRTAASVPN